MLLKQGEDRCTQLSSAVFVLRLEIVLRFLLFGRPRRVFVPPGRHLCIFDLLIFLGELLRQFCDLVRQSIYLPLVVDILFLSILSNSSGLLLASCSFIETSFFPATSALGFST